MKHFIFAIVSFFVLLAGGLYMTIPRPIEPWPLSPWSTRRPLPVLVADQPYEAGVVQEPDVHLDSGKYKMWYTAGWEYSRIAYAESTDGISWTKSGPVMGMGAGGFAGATAHHSVLIRSDTYYLFFADTLPKGAALYVAQSSDGLHFRPYEKILEPGQQDIALANAAVWVEGPTWHMLYESQTNSGSWQLFLAEGSDATHWRKVAGPLSTLSHGGMYGGPWIERIANGYRLTYHAARSGNLPTDIYQAISTNLIDWQPVDSRPLLMRELSWEVDQIADPSIVGDRLYYDGMDNNKPAGSIGFAISK